MKMHEGKRLAESLEECKALYASLPADLVDPAVAFLKKELAPVSEEIRAMIAADPSDWWIPHHLHWGMATRNALRQAGFGEEYFGVGNLDDIYVSLIESAIREASE